MATSCTASEVMMVAAAREIEDRSVVVAGTGLPLVAAVLAKRFYAPNAVLVTEAGLVDFDPLLPLYSISDCTASHGTSYACELYEVFATFVGRGFVDVAILGVADIDRFGNINTTVVGDYLRPRLRMGGAGGAPEFLAQSRKSVLTMRGGHFVETLDYLTSPGYLKGKPERDNTHHFPLESGPRVLVSRKGVFRFDAETGEIYLDALAPGQSTESVQADIPWRIRVAHDLGAVAFPSEEEIDFIRHFDITVSLPRRERSVPASRRESGKMTA